MTAESFCSNVSKMPVEQCKALRGIKRKPANFELNTHTNYICKNKGEVKTIRNRKAETLSLSVIYA